MTTPSNSDPAQQGTPAGPPQGTPATPPQSTPAPPQTQPQTPPQNPASQANTPGIPNFGEVLTALNALPEKIVNSLREATQAAKPPAQAQPAQDTGQQTAGSQAGAQQSAQPAQQATKEPAKKTFAERWFGV